MITSMREHKGYLYIGGILNNRVGRLKLDGADPDWTGPALLLGAVMIGGLARAFDNLLGRGEAAVTVPPLDGALRPNRALDEAASRLPLADVDCLAVVVGRTRRICRRRRSIALDADGAWHKRGELRRRDRLPRRDRRRRPRHRARRRRDRRRRRPLRRAPLSRRRRRSLHHRAGRVPAPTSIVANGSATNGAADWQRDLLERNASGSIWRIDLESGDEQPRSPTVSPGPPASPSTATALVVSEAWKHRLVRLDRGGRHGRRCSTPTCPAIPAGSRPPRTATGWRCSRRAASSSSSCCASRPIASA